MNQTAFNTARAQLKALGIQLQYSNDYNEYRVNLKGGREATAYYTNDLDDARDTGLYMAGAKS